MSDTISAVRSTVERELAWALAFVATAAVGRASVIDDRSISLVWPAAGVAVLWLCTSRRGVLALDVVVLSVLVLAVNALTGAPLRLAATLVVTNLLQAGIFIALLRRLKPDLWGFGGRRTLGRLSDLAVLLVVAVLASAAAAGLGQAGLRWAVGSTDLPTYAAWWGRNTVGTVVLATLGLVVLPRVWGTGKRQGARTLARLLRPTDLRHALDVLLVAVVTGVLLFVAFADQTGRPLAFLAVFGTVLAGVRLGPIGVMVHNLVTAVVVIACTIAGSGPFATIEDVHTRAVTAQVLVALTFVTGLVLAFNRAERDEALARVEAAERESSLRATLLGGVLEQMQEGLVVLDDAGSVVLRNSAGRRLMGLEGEPDARVRSGDSYGLFHPDGSTVAPEQLPYARALAGERVEGEDFLVRSPSNPDDRVLEISAVPLADPLAGPRRGGPRRVIVSFRDVTVERQHRESLANFAGTVAHDLINPLTVVRGWADTLSLMYADGDVDPAQAEGMVGRIQAAGDHMSVFIDDLLSYTVARDAPLDEVELDLTATAEHVAALRRDGPTRPEIEVQPGMVVLADPVLVRQLIDNLVGNAVKYVAAGVRPRVRVSARPLGDRVEVSVTDNGIGVPEELRERIFESFQRAHTEGYRGTGIGLAICREVVARHGGQIRVEDAEPGPGSRFVLTLPGVPDGA